MLNIDEIEKIYPELIPTYETLAKMLVKMFHEQLDRKNIHATTSRVKEISSLIGKVTADQAEGGDRKYNQLQDITDLCGVRIITKMESDIDAIAAEVRKLGFEIDDDNYEDHRIKDPNDFGYLSLHLIISIDDTFSHLESYPVIKGLKAEIQIRSILQHAWAEMSHSFGYKSKDELPNKLKRSINRIAAVLESADLDFVRLKAEKEQYLADTKKPIDALSIGNLIEHHKVMNEIRDILSKKYGVQFSIRRNYETLFAKLTFFGIDNITVLENRLSENHSSFVKFVDLLFERRKDNRKYILFEAPLEYFMHYLGSAKDMDYWLEYRNEGGTFCRVDMSEEVTDFLQLHKDAIATS